MRFVTRQEIDARFAGKRVAIVGSGPGVLENAPDFIDGHDIVVRVNNYKLDGHATGSRTDVHYSFYGSSIRKTREQLIADGVTLCMCKCPDAAAIESDWHRERGKLNGVDFRWIYQSRGPWWFCDTYVPALGEFLAGFHLLDRHVPTTGFAAILAILRAAPAEVYLTGFDGFRSGLHNVNEPWRRKNDDDPIGHVPEAELAWLVQSWNAHPLRADKALAEALRMKRRFAA